MYYLQVNQKAKRLHCWTDGTIFVNEDPDYNLYQDKGLITTEVKSCVNEY